MLTLRHESMHTHALRSPAEGSGPPNRGLRFRVVRFRFRVSGFEGLGLRV